MLSQGFLCRIDFLLMAGPVHLAAKPGAVACGVHTFILSWAPAKGYGLNFYIFTVCAALLEAIRRMLTHSMPPSLIRCCEALAPSDAAAG